VKGNHKMFQIDTQQHPEAIDQMNTYTSLPLALVFQPDIKLYNLLAELSPDTPWGDRKIAAQKLGSMRNPEAVPGLLDALPVDPFWMVRCAIIQALEMIGDLRAIPTLREVAKSDGFQVVRSHAAKAVERLSQAG
jgi:HEAT repeat protein